MAGEPQPLGSRRGFYHIKPRRAQSIDDKRPRVIVVVHDEDGDRAFATHCLKPSSCLGLRQRGYQIRNRWNYLDRKSFRALADDGWREMLSLLPAHWSDSGQSARDAAGDHGEEELAQDRADR